MLGYAASCRYWALQRKTQLLAVGKNHVKPSPLSRIKALPSELPRARIDESGKAEQRRNRKRARNKECG
jgi:hypothetical protein